MASSTMTAASDNFSHAFALFLGASLFQMGWVSGLPQLFGALCQLLSVWIASYFPRRPFIVAMALLQACAVLAMAVLACYSGSHAVITLIALTMIYQACLNLIEPHWRAWMGHVVPARRRGKFFASRTRLTMLSSLAVFMLGGGLLSFTEKLDVTWLGFSLLFLSAATGRFISARLLWQMHDPVAPDTATRGVFQQTLRRYAEALKDDTFRHYSLFVATMSAMVAISGPFFAVYMLKDLQWTYLQFIFTSVASVLSQFVTLRFWGLFSDKFGNHRVMTLTSAMLPCLPLLWLFSANYSYIIGVQIFAGLAWSGFTLSTANYLYDIRPHHTDFASYAALQSSLKAGLIFIGAIAGGAIATHSDWLVSVLQWHWLGHGVFVVFLSSAVLRAVTAWWFIPRLVEPKIRQRPRLLQLVFRIRGFNAISGLGLDWLTVARRSRAVPPDDQK